VNLLLDTHALIWAVSAPERLSEAARSAIIADGAEVYASHVSLWEMAIKRRLGKLHELDRSAVDWFETFVPKSRMRQLPISVAHLGAVEFLATKHNDPFDRLLVTQARHESLVIITKDELVNQYDVDVIW
jgi:PIN domain nuclease of toxin-antitoxin system